MLHCSGIVENFSNVYVCMHSSDLSISILEVNPEGLRIVVTWDNGHLIILR